jgi:hypothetical protein
MPLTLAIAIVEVRDTHPPQAVGHPPDLLAVFHDASAGIFRTACPKFASLTSLTKASQLVGQEPRALDILATIYPVWQADRATRRLPLSGPVDCTTDRTQIGGVVPAQYKTFFEVSAHCVELEWTVHEFSAVKFTRLKARHREY